MFSLLFSVRSLAVAALALATLAGAASQALAAPSLTVTPITWGVIGLDSNDVSSGPDAFPVGTRVCNTGTTDATDVVATFVWNSANAYLSLAQPPTQSVGTIAAGACADVYFTAVVARNSAAYNTARRFQVDIAADGLATVATPTPRELFVEHLVSQNRNAVISFSGPTSVEIGQIVTYTITTKTATGGYEQLEAFSTFPSSIFRIVSTSTTYSAPPGATNDKLYADACGWDPLPTSGTYRDCVGPAQYSGGKAGGNPITTIYTLQVVGAGSASVQTLIYDFSGSSYHYNSDFGTAVTSITSTAPAADLSVTASDAPDPVATGGLLSYSLSVANAGPSDASSLVLTADVPPGATYVSASGSGWSCSQAGGTVTCTRPSLAAGSTAPGVTVQVAAPGTAGSISLAAGISSATPDSVSANDTDTETTTVSAPAGNPPDAVDDVASTAAGSAVVILVLANDSDPDGDPLAVTGATQPGHGSVACTAMECTYSPDAGFNGPDSFAYTVSDGNGGTDTATVSVTVRAPPNNAPDAVDDAATTGEGIPVVIAVLGNDTDPDGDPLAVTGASQPASGSVACTAAQCTYTPAAGFSGSDSFTYDVSDGRGGADTATVSVTVTAAPPPPNTPPTAVDDAASTTAGQAAVVLPLANDVDADHDPLAISTSTQPANGSVACTASQCTYSPAAGFSGVDAFAYTVSDGQGGTDTATVTVTVSMPPNTAPDAVDDVASTAAASIATISVLANDTDPDGDPLAISALTQPPHGGVTCTAAACTYTPAPGFSGSDAFTYAISDGRGGNDTATVSITVTAPPAAPAQDHVPEARDDSAVAHGGLPVDIPVLANDSDPDGDALVIVDVAQPSSGFVSCGGGTCTYTPAPGFRGTAAFTYTVSDGRGGADSAVVTVDVDDGMSGGSRGGGVGGGPGGVGSDRGAGGTLPAETAAAVLVASKRSLVHSVDAGDVVAYKIAVRNRGRGVARNVRVCDIVSDAVVFVRAPRATFSRGRACWFVAQLRPHAGRVFGVVVRVDRTARRGRVTNTAVVSARGIRASVLGRAVVRVRRGAAPARAGGVTG